MKIAKYLMAILSVCALSVACTKDYYIEGDDGVQMSHIDYTIHSNDWAMEEVSTGGYLLSVSLNVPQISQQVVKYGSVTVSRRLTDNKGNTYWTPLPVVRAESENYGTEQELLYSTYLDYEWTVGNVYVYFTTTDFYVDPDKAAWPDMDLRVTIWQYD